MRLVPIKFAMNRPRLGFSVIGCFVDWPSSTVLLKHVRLCAAML
jgi:hypothetical protein